MADLAEFTDANFQKEVLEAELPVLIDLWAVWCSPCRMVGPIVEQLAAEYTGKVIVGKMDVDTNPVTPTQYGVQGIPTVILFNGGQEVDRIIGARPKGQFVEMLERHINN